MEKMLKKQTVTNYVFEALNHAFFLLFTLMCIFPFYYLFINTISNNGPVYWDDERANCRSASRAGALGR